MIKTNPQHPVVAYVEDLLHDELAQVEKLKPSPATMAQIKAQGVFPCLLWEAAGLRLAVALAQLRAVVPAPTQLRLSPDDPAWLMGRSGDAGELRIIDPAAWIWAEQGTRSPARGGAERLLLAGRDGWALACPPGADTLQLRSAEVKWRTESTRRRWLAGTAQTQRCALIDVDALIDAVAATFAE